MEQFKLKNFYPIVRSKGTALLLVLAVLPTSKARADWAASYSGLNGAIDTASGMTTDSSGNSFVIGRFNSDTLVLGGTTLTRIGAQDVFVAKLDSSGVVLWGKNYGGTGATAYGTGVAVDGSGNVYLSGYFNGANLTTPALTKIGNADAFAIKLDSSGNTTWAKNYGGTGATTTGSGIAADASGNGYLIGYLQSANLTTPALTKIGNTDSFVVKLNSSGTTTWSQNFGGSGSTAYSTRIAVDGSGNVYLTGYFSVANLTTPALTMIGGQTIYAIKLDSTGALTWARKYGSASLSYGSDIAVDGTGNVYLAGMFSNNMTTPALTNIGTGTAFDAFLIKLDSGGSVTWAKNFGGAGALTSGANVAVDGSGNVFLQGTFSTANITTPALTKIGTSDMFVIKLNSSGTTTWAKNFGGAGAGNSIGGIAVDGSGDAYLSGSFGGADLTTPALTRIGSSDTHVIKLDSSGTATWAKNFGGTVSNGTFGIFGVTKDSAGNIYLAGSFTSTKFYIGSSTLTQIGSSKNLFAAKLNAFGTVLWAKNYGGAGVTTDSTGIAVDGSGNVYLSGTFDTANMTTPALTKIGYIDSVVIKLDSSGNTIWAKNYGGTSAYAYSKSIAVDGSGNVYLAGYLELANFTNPALTKIGTRDAFVIKINSSGTTTWAKNYSGAGVSAYGYGVAVDGSGNVYLAGQFSNASLTSPAITKIGTTDTFVFKLDSSGTITWAKNFGGAGAIAGNRSIAIDGTGNVYVGGYFYTANLTAPALTLIGTRDAYAFKLDSSGNTTWAKNFGGAGATVTTQGISVDGSGKVYLAGYFANASFTNPALTLIGTQDIFAIQLDSSGTTIWSQRFGGAGATSVGTSLAVDGTGNVVLGGYFSAANLTTPALTRVSTQDALIIDVQLFNTACTVAGKLKFDITNNVMVFCDGAFWQSMNNAPAVTCTGTTNGKIKYYSSGASSDFVWYAGSCRSAKSATTFGACAVNGKIEWDPGNSTVRGCINGTWTSLKGW